MSPPRRGRARLIGRGAGVRYWSVGSERELRRMTIKLYAFTCGTVTGEFWQSVPQAPDPIV